MKEYSSYSVALFIGLAGLIAAITAYKQMQAHDNAAIHKQLIEQSHHLQKKVSKHLQYSIFSLEQKSASAFNKAANGYYLKRSPALVATGWINKELQHQWLEHSENNTAINKNHTTFIKHNKDIFTASEKPPSSTISPAFELAKNNWGLLVYSPFYTDSTLQGYLIEAYSIDNVFNEILSSSIKNDFNISVTDGNNFIYKSHNNIKTENKGSSNTIEFQLSANNREWQVFIGARPSLIENNSAYSKLVLFFGVSLSILISLLIYLALNLNRSKINNAKTDEALIESKQKYSVVVNSVIDGLITINKDGIITECNKAAQSIFGYENDEIIGLKINELLANNNDPILDLNSNNKHSGQDFETEGKRKDGHYFLMNMAFNEFTLVNNNYYIASIRNITEWKNLEKDLNEAKNKAQEATKQKTVFLANMSHELRTPISGIVGTNHLLKQTKLSETQERYIDSNQYSANLLLRLISDILDLTKIEAGQLELEHISFDSKLLFTELSNLFMGQCKQKGLTLKLEIKGDSAPWVLGDPDRLQQIMTSLVDNAIKFTESGEVRIRIGTKISQSNTAALTIAVDDSGIGIPPDELENIFDDFNQSDKSSTREKNGTGLGLSICKRLVELMDGTINVNSIPHKGSTFWFTLKLPLAEDESIPLKDTTDIDQSTTLNGKNILVVEDNEINKMIARTLLETYGCNVQCANNGLEGVEEVANHQYDLVLMDCQMPVMDGFDATNLIRENEKQLPIVALTANALTGDREKCLRAGMDDYLSKPIDPNALKHTLERWLTHH